MKRKWRWAASIGGAGFVILFFYWRSSSRALWTIEAARLGGVMPTGEVIVSRSNHLYTVSRRGNMRLFQPDLPNTEMLATDGGRGFVGVNSVTHTTTFFTWEGKVCWSYPIVAVRCEVTSDGMAFLLGNDMNLYARNGDGSIAWSEPVNCVFLGMPNRHAFAVAEDDSVAFVNNHPYLKYLSVRNKDGSIRWSSKGDSGPNFVMSRTGDGGLVIGGLSRVKAYSAEGKLRWDIPFPPRIPGTVAASKLSSGSGAMMSLTIDSRGYSYCHSNDGVLYVLDNQGRYQWSYPWNTFQVQGEMAFTATGEAIFYSGKQRLIPAPPGNVAMAESHRRLVCLSPNGELRWEVQLPGRVNWNLPRSKAEWSYGWATRFGLQQLSPVGNLQISPDGTVYLCRYFWSQKNPAVYAIRGDRTDR